MNQFRQVICEGEGWWFAFFSFNKLLNLEKYNQYWSDWISIMYSIHFYVSTRFLLYAKCIINIGFLWDCPCQGLWIPTSLFTASWFYLFIFLFSYFIYSRNSSGEFLHIYILHSFKVLYGRFFVSFTGYFSSYLTVRYGTPWVWSWGHLILSLFQSPS